MRRLRNSAGRPLSSSVWLEAHHRAKRPERRAFAQRIAELQPTRVVDLGCGTGLWLDELNAVLPTSCELIGIDMDEFALAAATTRAAAWMRPWHFEQLDLSDDERRLPDTDVALLFNVSSYIPDLDRLLDKVARCARHLVIRQYDGATMRFGPMHTADRALIENSLRTAVLHSRQFGHYDIDRLYSAIHATPFGRRDIGFELFSRTSPFPPEFVAYFEGLLNWTRGCLSSAAAERLDAWCETVDVNYFCEVDLIATLSS